MDIEHPYQYALGDEMCGMIPLDEMESYQSVGYRMSPGDSGVERGRGVSMGRGVVSMRRGVRGGLSNGSRWISSSANSGSLGSGTNRIVLGTAYKDKSVLRLYESQENLLQGRGAMSRTRVEDYDTFGDLTHKCQSLEMPSTRVDESFVRIPRGPIAVEDGGGSKEKNL